MLCIRKFPSLLVWRNSLYSQFAEKNGKGMIRYCQMLFLLQLRWSFFSELIWWIPLMNFPLLHQPWIPGINPTWSRCVIPFKCYVHFANNWFKFFCLYVQEACWTLVFFSSIFPAWFWHRENNWPDTTRCFPFSTF